MPPTNSTQQLIKVKELRDGVVILENGSLRKIMMVSGINFDLKSEEEQNIILYSFQDLLNTLDFSIQVLIHSRKGNIEPYLQRLRERKKLEENELLKVQIDEYAEFIKSFVADNAIMIKTFFIVVPYEVIRLPTQKEPAETYR